MSHENDIKTILNDFFRNASPEEQRELEELLRKRKQNISASGSAIPDARDMAARISRQMGLTSDQIRKSAREIVAEMILQYDPGISDSKLKVLTDLFVSGGNKAAKIPPDALRAMTVHFIDYSLGRMPENQHRELPPGWHKKYWGNFPENIQVLISELLKDMITEEQFWKYCEREFQQ